MSVPRHECERSLGSVFIEVSVPRHECERSLGSVFKEVSVPRHECERSLGSFYEFRLDFRNFSDSGFYFFFYTNHVKIQSIFSGSSQSKSTVDNGYNGSRQNL